MSFDAILKHVPDTQKPAAKMRLSLRAALQEVLPKGCRFRVFIPDDEQKLGGQPIKFGALIAHNRQTVKFSGQTAEEIIAQAQLHQFQA